MVCKISGVEEVERLEEDPYQTYKRYVLFEGEYYKRCNEKDGRDFRWVVDKDYLKRCKEVRSNSTMNILKVFRQFIEDEGCSESVTDEFGFEWFLKGDKLRKCLEEKINSNVSSSNLGWY